MCVVVLDALRRHAPLGGALRGGVVRVQIHRRRDGFQPVQVRQIRDRPRPKARGARVVEIADVRADHRVAAGRQRDRAFHLRPRPRPAIRRARQRHRVGRQAAPAPHRNRRAGARRDHRIVQRPRDGPVVQQKEIRDIAQPRPGFVVVRADRLVGQVAARGHHREPQFAQQQVVQRRIRQHRAQPRQARRDFRRQTRRAGEPPQQHDGRRRRLQPDPFRRRNLAGRGDGIHVREHQREGFFIAPFALPQAPHGIAVARIRQQVEAADPFGGHDPPRAQGFRRGQQRLVARGQRRPRRPRPRQLRPADRARIGLGMEAPVARIAVFRRASRTHAETPHRRVRPVVGQSFEDAEPRAAVRAVRERIAVAPVGRIEDLPQAIRTRRQIRQDARDARAVRRGAQADFEPGRQVGRCAQFFHGLDVGRRRQPAGQFRAEARESFGGTGQGHLGAGRVVAHPAAQPQLVRQPERRRPEPHALHPPAHPQQNGPFFRHVSRIYATPPPRSRWERIGYPTLLRYRRARKSAALKAR